MSMGQTGRSAAHKARRMPSSANVNGADREVCRPQKTRQVRAPAAHEDNRSKLRQFSDKARQTRLVASGVILVDQTGGCRFVENNDGQLQGLFRFGLFRLGSNGFKSIAKFGAISPVARAFER